MTRIALVLLLAVASGASAQSGVSTQSGPQGARQGAPQSAPQVAPTTAPKPKADVIFTHANIYTGVVDATASLGAGKRAEALAVVGDRILAVGTRDEIMKLKGPETKIVDLEGHFVMPGFNDAHMHLASAGLEKMNVNMIGVKTLDEFRERLRAKCEAAEHRHSP